MLLGEHSAILLTFIKLPFVIKIFVLSILSGQLRQVLLYRVHTGKFVLTQGLLKESTVVFNDYKFMENTDFFR